MLTGVARFSKVSIFSDLNNLRDISFEPKYSAICGITDEEIDLYFKEGMKCLADSKGKTYDIMREELRKRYDGYHFSKSLVDVYNPFSLVNVFAANDFSDYWFSTGTPTYVKDLLMSRSWKLKNLDGYRIMATRLSQEGIMSKDLAVVLYQTGDLSIKDYN